MVSGSKAYLMRVDWWFLLNFQLSLALFHCLRYSRADLISAGDGAFSLVGFAGAVLVVEGLLAFLLDCGVCCFAALLGVATGLECSVLPFFVGV
jgi:hypothetical protein